MDNLDCLIAWYYMELGLSVSLDVALLYRINPSMAGDLFQNVGVDYAQVLIEPEAASVIRGLTSGKCFERYFNQIIYMY
jgi:hypothetical protein